MAEFELGFLRRPELILFLQLSEEEVSREKMASWVLLFLCCKVGGEEEEEGLQWKKIGNLEEESGVVFHERAQDEGDEAMNLLERESFSFSL